MHSSDETELRFESSKIGTNSRNSFKNLNSVSILVHRKSTELLIRSHLWSHEERDRKGKQAGVNHYYFDQENDMLLGIQTYSSTK